MWCFKRFYEGLWGLHKTFWRTTKKCENKNLSKFLFYYSFLKCTGLEWFTISYLLYIICEKWKLYKKEFSWSIKKVLETPRKAGKQFNTSSIILSKQWYHNIVLKIRCCSSHSKILLKIGFLKNSSIHVKTPVLESFFLQNTSCGCFCRFKCWSFYTLSEPQKVVCPLKTSLSSFIYFNFVRASSVFSIRI